MTLSMGDMPVSTTSSTVDTTAPDAPTGLAYTSLTSTSVTVTFTGPPQSDWAGINVYIAGSFFKTQHSTASSVALTGLTPGVSIDVQLTAWDTAGPPGNESVLSDVLTIPVPQVTDVTPPSVPSALRATNVTASSVALDWGDSVDDNSGLAGYNLYDGATLVSSLISGSNTTVGGLAAASTHNYSVTASDNAGNESAASNVVTVTTSPTGTGYSDLGIIASGKVTTATSTLTISFTKALAIGSGVIVHVGSSGGTTGTTVSDSKGNTYLTAVEVSNNASTGGKMVYAQLYCVLTVAIAVGDTMTINTVGQGISVEAEGFTGLAATPLDKTSNNGAGTTSAITSGATATTAQANEVVCGGGCLLATNTFTPASGITLVAANASTGGTSQRYVFATKQVLSATGSAIMTGTQKLLSNGTAVNNNYAAGVATYKITASVGSPPTNTTPPAVTGSTVVGSALSCSSGVWTGSPTYAYQWFRGTTLIPGATSSTYTTVTADVGQSLKCNVTATNGNGSTAVYSNTVGPITSVSGGNVSSTLVPKNGAWLAGWIAGGISSFESTVFGSGGRKLDVGYNYESLGAPSSTFMAAQAAAGRFAMISIEANSSGMTYRTVGAGAQDSFLISWAQKIAAQPGKVFVVLYHEGDHKLHANNDAGTGPGVGMTAADYKAAYKHSVDVLRAHGATNAVFVLCFAGPTSTSTSNAGQYVDGMYPGAGYVDWVTCDPYKAFGAAISMTTIQSWQATINFVKSTSRVWHNDGVAYGITETGVDLISEGGANYTDPVASAWYTNGDGWTSAATSLGLKMVTLFDQTKTNDVYCRIEGNSAVRSAYASMAGAAFWNQPHS